jgi:hypothetical protein
MSFHSPDIQIVCWISAHLMGPVGRKKERSPIRRKKISYPRISLRRGRPEGDSIPLLSPSSTESHNTAGSRLAKERAPSHPE